MCLLLNAYLSGSVWTFSVRGLTPQRCWAREKEWSPDASLSHTWAPLAWADTPAASSRSAPPAAAPLCSPAPSWAARSAAPQGPLGMPSPCLTSPWQQTGKGAFNKTVQHHPHNRQVKGRLTRQSNVTLTRQVKGRLTRRSNVTLTTDR